MNNDAPEKILEGKKRPFTGKEYLKSLQDDREVYMVSGLRM